MLCFKQANKIDTAIYIYIYILDSHMAPYGACEVAQSTARSKAQFEAERFRKEIRRKKKHCRKCFRRGKKHARKCFRRKKKHARAVVSSVGGSRARSSSDFERAVASKEKEACSSIDFERSVASKEKKHARALISSAQRPQSTFEQ